MAAFSFIAATDTANMQAGGTSVFEDVTNIFTKGLGGAVVSGWHAIANTGIDLSNKLFDTDIERRNTSQALHEFDQGFGEYYDRNKAIIDTAGFIGGSLVPGLTAVKGLKMLGAGEATGIFSKVLGYSARKERLYLDKALAEIGQEGGSVFTRINANKLSSMAWGTADNALQAAAYETATALTMNASPLLENEEWDNILWDITKTSLAGGLIGGGIGALVTNQLVKGVGKQVEAKVRLYDALGSNATPGMAFGDRAFGILEALEDLPKEIMDPTVVLNLSRGDLTTKSLDLTNLLTKTLADSVDAKLLKLGKSLVEVTGDDKTVGQPFSGFLISMVKQGLEAKAPPGEIKRKAGDYLWNLRSVEAIGARPLDLSQELVYINPKAKLTGVDPLLTAVRVEGGKAYRVVGDQNTAKFGVIGVDGPDRQTMLKDGFDVLTNPKAGTVEINPNSEIYQLITDAEADYAPRFMNVRSGIVSDTTVATAADLATTKVPITTNFEGVQAGAKLYPMKINKFEGAEATVAEVTARHAWFGNGAVKQIGGEITSGDISALDALLQNPALAAPDLMIFDRISKTAKPFKDINSFDAFVFRTKFQTAVEWLEKRGLKEGATAEEIRAAEAKLDLRELAYRINAEPAWVDGLVSTRFSELDAYKATTGWQRDLKSYMQRDNVVLRYDTKAELAAQASPEGIVAYHSRVKAAKELSNRTAKLVIEDGFEALPEFKEFATRGATSAIVGPGILGSSNAAFTDTLRATTQYIGQIVQQLSTEAVNRSTTNLMTPAARLLKNPRAAAEVSAATTAGRLKQKAQALWTDEDGVVNIIELGTYMKIKNGMPPAFKRDELIPLSEEAGEFILAHHKENMRRVEKRMLLNDASGISNANLNPDKLYFPPVDTQRLPYFAFVRERDGTLFGSSEVAMITARDPAELAKKIAAIESDKTTSLRVITKDGSEDYFKAKGDYDFSRTMNEPAIDSTLRSQHKLGDYIPNMTPEAVIEDYVQYTQRAETGLIRDAVTMKYGQEFTELEDLSKRYTAVERSKFQGTNKEQRGTIADPFGDYQRLALNISKRGQFTLLHQANEFVDAVGTKAFRGIEGAMHEARAGKITWEQANLEMQKFGLGPHFTDKELFEVAQTATDRNLIKVGMQKANMILSTGMLRLDWANSLLNVLSTPILLSSSVSAIKNSIKTDPEMLAIFKSLQEVNVPGSSVKIPSTTKMTYNAVASINTPEGKVLMQRFKDLGIVRGPMPEFHAAIEELSLVPTLIPSEFAKKADKWVERGATWTGNNMAEEYTRYAAAHVMYQMTQPMVAKGAMSVKEQNIFMSIFTNQVQGNYIASQRPILFQGTIGAAVGLFQTYQFNLFQQLFRHIGNKDAKTVAVMGALQTTLYGANGVPGFDAINTYLVGNASMNEGREDAYTLSIKALGKDYGDWLMYGSASAMPFFSEKAPALYTRGDLNPRTLFILPTSPLEVPAVSASIKIVGNLLNTAKQIGNGADVSDALLHGLEHNGLNRPLQGLAQVMKGNATTSKGQLISASSDLDMIATASRLMGARPLDESIAVNQMFRAQAYKAMDKQKIDALGAVIKDKLRNNQTLTSEDWTDFQGKYAAAGGRVEGFTQAVQRWDRAANESVVNTLREHNNTLTGRRLMETLGADPMEDYRNTPQQ